MSDDSKGLPLEENPNWKGGRTVASNGYVLVKRQDHPRSDSRGYIYEHRLVAEEKLGRPLREDEHVHHKNGEKQDNDPENLEVLSAQEHRARHRESEDLREPGEPNPLIECACGCGEELWKYDEENRPRRYISGHNMHGQDRPVLDGILEVLQDGPARRSEIAQALDTDGDTLSPSLWKLKNQGEIANPKHGVYSLPKDIDEVHDPRDDDTVIECACGCGETLNKYDDWGRERKYINGHNRRSGGDA